jgi:hypothetical protein
MKESHISRHWSLQSPIGATGASPGPATQARSPGKGRVDKKTRAESATGLRKYGSTTQQPNYSTTQPIPPFTHSPIDKIHVNYYHYF